MTTVLLENRGNAAILRLNNGVLNPINPAMIADLTQALKNVQKEFRGLVLAGGNKFFSMGFDLPHILNFNRSQMGEFFYEFNELCLNLYTLPVPTVCAIAGHAVAGGCVLASTCDFRFAASGKKLMGVNEIKLGVPYPYLVDMILRQLVGDRAATKLIYEGEFTDTAGAKEMGLVDALFSPEEVEEKAVEAVKRLGESSRSAFSAMKAARTETVRKQYLENGAAANETFLDCWFGEPARSLLKEAAEKFNR
jgi:enoyl-CoA hydratase/carnithine racemase